MGVNIGLHDENQESSRAEPVGPVTIACETSRMFLCVPPLTPFRLRRGQAANVSDGEANCVCQRSKGKS
jgi:hypothetical protein